MSLVIPTGREIRKLIKVDEARLEVEEFIAQMLGAQPRVSFTELSFEGVKSKGDIKMAELREGQEFTVTAAFKTKAGNPASYQTGSAAWTSSDATVASVTADPANELSAKVMGLNGAANTPVLISFTADGDPDVEERPLIATLDVVVTQGEAVVAELAAGTPIDTP